MPTEFPTGTRVTAAVIGEITDQLECSSEMDTVGQRPLTSTAGTITSIITKTHDFKVGYAYKIDFQARVQVNGLAANTMGAVELSLRRASATGTVIINPGFTAVPGLSQFTRVGSWVLVKVTVADTTQTLALCAQFANINSSSSLDIEAGSSAPTMIDISVHGLASDHPEAMELPTA